MHSGVANFYCLSHGVALDERDISLILEFLHFLLERSLVANLRDHHLLKERPDAHSRQSVLAAINGLIYFVQKFSELVRPDAAEPP